MATTITYTLSSIAFPTLPPRDRERDSLNIEIHGSPSAGITFEWIELGGEHWPNGALQVRAFSDALGTLLDPRIQAVLDRLRRKRERNRDVIPAVLIGLLEDQGAIPSHYHVRGLLDRDDCREADRARLAKLYERAKALDR